MIIFFYFRPKIVADLFTHKNDLNLVPSNIAIRGYLGIFISAISRKKHINFIAFRQASTTNRRVAKVFVDR